MDCITKLKEMKEVFTKTEKKIAKYILGNLESIKGMRAKELGALIGISQPSIIRFAKKLGYKGFPEFKIALSEAIITKNDVPIRTSKNIIKKLSLNFSSVLYLVCEGRT